MSGNSEAEEAPAAAPLDVAKLPATGGKPHSQQLLLCPVEDCTRNDGVGMRRAELIDHLKRKHNMEAVDSVAEQKRVEKEAAAEAQKRKTAEQHPSEEVKKVWPRCTPARTRPAAQ